MVTVAPSPLLEPGAPGWAQRFALRLGSFFVPQNPNRPQRLSAVAFADLPPAADWPGSVCYVSDKGKVGLSNGAAWVAADGSAL